MAQNFFERLSYGLHGMLEELEWKSVSETIRKPPLVKA